MYLRIAEPQIRTALRDTRVVAISGPRQSGKTTLARRFAKLGRSFVTLDDQSTLAAATDHYVRVLEQLYLIQRVQPWFRNELSRLVKTPKFHFIDSGLLTAMRGYSLSRSRADRTVSGALLESFVFSELLKLSAWTQERVSCFTTVIATSWRSTLFSRTQPLKSSVSR
jgi:predicted AAA+ superfamily ATPase